MRSRLTTKLENIQISDNTSRMGNPKSSLDRSPVNTACMNK